MNLFKARLITLSKMKKYIVTILSSLIFTISCQKNYEVQGTVKGNLLNDNAYIVDSSAVNASGVNSLSINKAKTSYRPKILPLNLLMKLH